MIFLAKTSFPFMFLFFPRYFLFLCKNKGKTDIYFFGRYFSGFSGRPFTSSS